MAFCGTSWTYYRFQELYGLWCRTLRTTNCECTTNRILATNTTRVTAKLFPPKNFISCRRNCSSSSSSYHMSLLLLSADPGTRWTRTAEPWVAWTSSYPLNHEVHVQRIILELADKLLGRRILTENFLVQVLAGGRSRTAAALFIKLGRPVP